MNISNEYMNNSYLLVNTRILRENVLSVVASLPEGTQLIPVLKGDAYGMGLAECARVIAELPMIRTIAVAHPSEALRLRELGIKKDILLMGHPVPFQLPALLENGITLTVGRPGLLREILALNAPGRIKLQCKLDTGLHRIGFAPGEMLDGFLHEYREAGERVELSGVFSHFIDGSDRSLCSMQFERFQQGLRQFDAAGIPVPMRHISESAASELFPEYALDAVRIGRRLMFDHPTAPTGTVRECASWRTWVTGLYERRAGENVGYFSGRRLERDCTVALLGVGYGDGLPSALANGRGHVLIRGRLCPLLVTCMDVCLADVTGVGAEIGDEVTLFGYDREGNFLSAQTQANTFGADEGCGISNGLTARVQRIYTEEE